MTRPSSHDELLERGTDVLKIATGIAAAIGILDNQRDLYTWEGGGDFIEANILLRQAHKLIGSGHVKLLHAVVQRPGDADLVDPPRQTKPEPGQARPIAYSGPTSYTWVAHTGWVPDPIVSLSTGPTTGNAMVGIYPLPGAPTAPSPVPAADPVLADPVPADPVPADPVPAPGEADMRPGYQRGGRHADPACEAAWRQQRLQRSYSKAAEEVAYESFVTGWLLAKDAAKTKKGPSVGPAVLDWSAQTLTVPGPKGRRPGDDDNFDVVGDHDDYPVGAEPGPRPNPKDRRRTIRQCTATGERGDCILPHNHWSDHEFLPEPKTEPYGSRLAYESQQS